MKVPHVHCIPKPKFKQGDTVIYKPWNSQGFIVRQWWSFSARLGCSEPHWRVLIKMNKSGCMFGFPEHDCRKTKAFRGAETKGKS